MPLTDTAIRKAAPGEKLRRLSDERGLYLEIAPSGGKWWRWKYRYGGKEKRLSLGTYPDTTLKAARAARDGARSQLAAGIDPGAARKAIKAARTDAPANSFEAVAREWLAAIHGAKVSEGHAERTRIRLERDVFPWLGTQRIGEIKAPELLTCLGVLVTTSDYGPDSYDFARGKPLVLLNGANLLHMLEKHGHRARIDLHEAKRAAQANK